MLLAFVSSQQRFGVTDIKALGMSQLSGLRQTVLELSGLKWTVLSLLDKSVLQLRVTALFYLDNSRKIHLRGVRTCPPKRKEKSAPLRGRETETALWLLFLYVFSLPLGLLYVNWFSQECCLFYLKSSLLVLRPSFVLFSRAFPLLLFCCCCCCCCVTSVVSDSVQPTRLPIPGILQARTLEWVAISFSNA